MSSESVAVPSGTTLSFWSSLAFKVYSGSKTLSRIAMTSSRVNMTHENELDAGRTAPVAASYIVTVNATVGQSPKMWR